MLDIGSEPASFQMHLAARRMFTKKTATLLRGFGQQVDRPVQADLEKIVPVLQAGEASLIFQIGAIPAKTGLDHLAGFRVRPDIARQGQKLQRYLQVDGTRRRPLGKRRAFRLLRLRIAKLHIGAIRAVADIDGKATCQIIAKMPVADDAFLGGGVVTIGHKLAGEFTFGIVRAADEGAELAKPQPKPPALAVRAAAHQLAFTILLEKVRAKLFVEHVDDIGDGQVGGAVDGGLEIAPEPLEKNLPVQLAVGYLVKLAFQLGGEIIFDIAGEEIVQEGDDKPPTVFRNELATVLHHIGPVLKHLDDRGVGRRAADAELLHCFHQAGVGKSRRRLREMLVRCHLAGGQPFAAIDSRQDTAVNLLVGLDGVRGGIAPFLIDRTIAVKDDNAATGAKHDAFRRVADVDGGLVKLGRFHLAGDGTLPDQVIEPLLVIIEMGADVVGRAADVGRANGLVGFLRVGRRGAVHARAVRQIAVAEPLADLAANRGQRFAAKLHAVCPHIGD